MFKVLFLKKNKVVFEREFKTRQDAADFVHGEAHDYPYEYEIYDIVKQEVVDDGQLESADDIIEGTMNNLFPDEDSEEGFDIDDHFDNN